VCVDVTAREHVGTHFVASCLTKIVLAKIETLQAYNAPCHCIRVNRTCVFAWSDYSAFFLFVCAHTPDFN
jgi:hypothetical protein